MAFARLLAGICRSKNARATSIFWAAICVIRTCPPIATLTIRWLYFERDARLPSRKTQDEVFNLEGSGVVSAYSSPSEVTFPKGTYACEFRPSDEFDVSPLSAQIELTTD